MADIGPFEGTWHLQVLEDFGFIVSRRYEHYKIFYPTGRKIPLHDPRLVLKNKTAKEIFRFVSKNPGTYQNEIAKELGKAHGTIRYNLKKLVKAEIIEVTSDNGRKKFFISEEKLINLRDKT
jgi:predicted HTH transcriptional regulator